MRKLRVKDEEAKVQKSKAQGHLAYMSRNWN